MKNRPDYFYIFSNSGGCPQNQLDGGKIITYLKNNGYECKKNPARCNILIINSCSYNNLKEEQSFRETLKLSNSSGGKKQIILTGCLPKIAPKLLTDLPDNIKIIPGSELEKIEEIFPPRISGWKQVRINYIPEPLFSYSKKFRRFLYVVLSSLRYKLNARNAYYLDYLFMYDHSPGSFIVEISRGCLGNCTYCVIRRSRGVLKSRPADEIINEIRNGIENGVKEIMLTATETAAYGIDTGTSFAELLNSILKLLTNQRLIIFYANPRWLINDWKNLIPAFASGKIHFIHLSLNGGSDNVLKGMRRGYTLKEFENLILSIKKLSPRTILQTQVITGFPGETEEDFNTTVNFFRSIYFHNVQVHAFDPREGSEAGSMTDQVPESIKQRRRRNLYRITLASKLKHNIRYILSGSEFLHQE